MERNVENLDAFEIKMQKALEHFYGDMKTVRTGRANVSVLDGLRVEYYGDKLPLSQIATLNTPDASSITVDPWDKSLIRSIEKVVLESDLGLNPSNDGILIRIHIPALTQERRKEILKVAKKKVEEGKIAIRNIRRDANDHIKKLEKDGDISEDEAKKLQDTSQKMTDRRIEEIQSAYLHKEKEILEV